MLTSVLFYVGGLGLVNRFVNRFQPNRDRRGLPAFPYIRRRSSRNVQIFGYHRVNDERDPFFPGTPVAVFATHMEYLATHCSLLSLEEAAERIKRGDVPDNAVVITFDDGYRDNYSNAFPILKRLSIPATIFLATAPLASREVLWHDAVFSAFRKTHEPVLAGFPDGAGMDPLGTVAQKLATQDRVLEWLKSLDDVERWHWIRRLRELLKVGTREEAPQLMLTWDEVQTMHAEGIAFGAHTVTHPILSKLPAVRAREEIQVSKRTIEERLGIPIRTFAYPNGGRRDFSEGTKRMLAEAGFVCAVTSLFGANEVGQDLFELRRGGPWEGHLPTFAAKLSWYKFAAQG